MPNISSHMVVAIQVRNKLKLKDDNFIIGNLLPDLEEDKVKSHFKIQGKQYLVPDTDYFIKNYDLHNEKNLGILTHLLLDKYYLEDFLAVKYPSIDVFENKIIYKDYDRINKDIIDYFKLDINEIKKILETIKEEKYQERLHKNINCLFQVADGKRKYLETEEFISFLERISNKISTELKQFL